MGFLVNSCKMGGYWDRDNNRFHREIIKNGLQITEAFRKGLNFHKAGVSFYCRLCDKTRPKGTRYLCKKYENVCVDCATKWIEGSEETLNEIMKMLSERKSELAENESKWRKEQILGAIEEGK